MRRTMASGEIAAGLLIALLVGMAAPSLAQQQSQHVRGTIQATDGETLTVETRDGATVKIALAENFKILGLTEAALSDIKAGSFVGTAAIPRSDGTFTAQEVLIFPDSMHGIGEGHYPWDLTPDSTMTNATVDAVVEQVDGSLLTLKLGDRHYRIQVPPDAPIVTIAPDDESLLKPGAPVFISARPQGDTLTAGAVVVGKDGTVPPM